MFQLDSITTSAPAKGIVLLGHEEALDHLLTVFSTPDSSIAERQGPIHLEPTIVREFLAGFFPLIAKWISLTVSL